MFAGLQFLQENETDLLKSTFIETYALFNIHVKIYPISYLSYHMSKPGNKLLSYHNIVKILHDLKEL